MFAIVAGMTLTGLLPTAPRGGAPARLARLEDLRAHPCPDVQNRVGDVLRRAARRDPALVHATCARWLRESPGPATRRIVRRAMRPASRGG